MVGQVRVPAPNMQVPRSGNGPAAITVHGGGRAGQSRRPAPGSALETSGEKADIRRAEGLLVGHEHPHGERWLERQGLEPDGLRGPTTRSRLERDRAAAMARLRPGSGPARWRQQASGSRPWAGSCRRQRSAAVSRPRRGRGRTRGGCGRRPSARCCRCCADCGPGRCRSQGRTLGKECRKRAEVVDFGRWPAAVSTACPGRAQLLTMLRPLATRLTPGRLIAMSSADAGRWSVASERPPSLGAACPYAAA
jgi:hypothetical protein